MVEPMTRQLRKEFIADHKLQRLQTSIDDISRQASLVELTNGRLIENVALSTSDTHIVHGLGRAFRGWFVIRISAAGTILEAATQADTTKFLSLKASAGTPTVSVWVF
jgi:hypothetical protein